MIHTSRAIFLVRCLPIDWRTHALVTTTLADANAIKWANRQEQRRRRAMEVLAGLFRELGL